MHGHGATARGIPTSWTAIDQRGEDEGPPDEAATETAPAAVDTLTADAPAGETTRARRLPPRPGHRTPATETPATETEPPSQPMAPRRRPRVLRPRRRRVC